MPPEPRRLMISQRPTIAPGPRLVGEIIEPLGSTGDGVPAATPGVEIWVAAVPRPLAAGIVPCVAPTVPAPAVLDFDIMPRIMRRRPRPTPTPPPATIGIGMPAVLGGTAALSLISGADASVLVVSSTPAAGALPIGSFSVPISMVPLMPAAAS